MRCIHLQNPRLRGKSSSSLQASFNMHSVILIPRSCSAPLYHFRCRRHWMQRVRLRMSVQSIQVRRHQPVRAGMCFKRMRTRDPFHRSERRRTCMFLRRDCDQGSRSRSTKDHSRLLLKQQLHANKPNRRRRDASQTSKSQFSNMERV